MEINWRQYFKGRYRSLGGTLALLLTIYLLSLLFLRVGPLRPVWDLMRLEPTLVLQEWRLWTLVTYGLLHDPRVLFTSC